MNRDPFILYLARVLFDGRTFVHQISSHEFTIADVGQQTTCKRVRRAKSSWVINCFGVRGAAAIGDTPSSAIGAAKVLLERILIEADSIKAKAGVQRVSSYA